MKSQVKTKNLYPNTLLNAANTVSNPESVGALSLNAFNNTKSCTVCSTLSTPALTPFAANLSANFSPSHLNGSTSAVTVNVSGNFLKSLSLASNGDTSGFFRSDCLGTNSPLIHRKVLTAKPGPLKKSR